MSKNENDNESKACRKWKVQKKESLQVPNKPIKAYEKRNFKIEASKIGSKLKMSTYF